MSKPSWTEMQESAYRPSGKPQWKPSWFVTQACIVSVLATIAIVIGVTFTDTFNRHQRVQMGEAAVKERMENTLSSMTLRLNAKDMKIEALLDANRGIRVAYEECLAVTP